MRGPFTPEHQRGQLRQPRVAELVADVLRARILSGEFEDGGHLPRQDDLLGAMQVSKPSLREAFRILETEGLITVLRGKLGGAIVHAPGAGSAAYMLALVLEARDVPLRDVAIALAHIEPVCAAMCAQRADRHTAVVPRLREVHAEAMRQRDDLVALSVHTRRFHEALVEHCGNATFILIVGALGELWTGGQRLWAERADPSSLESVAAVSFRAHEEIIELIEAGDAEAVLHRAHSHLAEGIFYADAIEGAERVVANAVRADAPG